MMEAKIDEAKKAATFFAAVGLPVHLGQISLGPGDTTHLDTVAEVSMSLPLIHNMPLTVTPEVVKTAVLSAHEMGAEIASIHGDSAYRRLQSE
jgi:glycerol dehydrogenase